MIVHIITGLDIGGAETMLCRLLLAKEQPAVGQMVISLKSIGPIGVQLKQNGVRVEALELGKNIRSLTAMFRLVRLLRQCRPQIVQTWMYHADLFGGIAARLAGCRHLVWGIRGTYTPIGRPWTHRIMKMCAGLSGMLPQKILCVADAARLSHIAYGYAADKMAVIPNGVDFSDFDSRKSPAVNFRALNDWPDDSVIVGCVGRFHPDKGQDLLLQVASLVRQRTTAAKFVMIGRGCDTENQYLTDLITKYQLGRDVLLLGERHDIPACLNGFDIFCLPSRTEGFPNVLAEAMAVGIPAVATKVGDVAMLAADTVTVVPAGDASAIAQGLLNLISLPASERKICGEAASRSVRQSFSIKAIRKQYDDFYQQLVEK